MQVIEHPVTTVNEPPADLREFKPLRHTCAASFGWSVELLQHSDGRVVEITQRNTAWNHYRLFTSAAAWEIENNSHATRDPEGHGGRFFPSDYSRLKITRKDVKDESGISRSGWRHAPACNCVECGFLVDFHKVHFAWDDGYIPFCSDCYGVWFTEIAQSA